LTNQLYTSQQQQEKDKSDETDEVAVATNERLFQLLLMLPIPTNQNDIDNGTFLFPPPSSFGGDAVGSDSDEDSEHDNDKDSSSGEESKDQCKDETADDNTRSTTTTGRKRKYQPTAQSN
jgi:hypothetical protein